MTPYPKVELHVHLEATVRPSRLLEIARRNDVALPAADEEGMAELQRFSDFEHFVQVWVATSAALRRERDFHQVVVDYAGEAAAQGCMYIEAIFSPAEPVRRGTSWQEVFEGYCSGGQEAEERFGIEVRFTPDITRDFPAEVSETLVSWALKYRDRGVVGIGLGGDEQRHPPEGFARPFALAREGGLKAAPHAGETAGPDSVRTALEVLGAQRLRHGVRAAEDAGLLAEIAARGVTCDVALTSNILLGVVPALSQHPLRRMLAAGVPCSVSTDDPALMGIDLECECAAAVRLGHTPVEMYRQGVAGAFCDEAVKARLRKREQAFDWAAVPTDPAQSPCHSNQDLIR
jgi:aminodeoxyfutalosine deaminase